MTSIIISGRPNSEEMSECIIVAKNIANMYPSSRFTIVLKSPKEWEKYCEDLCNLFGILKKTHPLILFSNGNKIGGAQEFFKLISDSFKYDKLIKKNKEYILDIDPSEITKLTRENTLLIEKEYFCRIRGKTVLDKINEKLEVISNENFSEYYKKYNTIEIDYTPEYIEDMKVYVKYSSKYTPDPKDYIEYPDVIEQRPAYVDRDKYNEYHEELREKIELEKKLRKEAEEEAKRKAEEELKAKEEENKGEEENKETDESVSKKKDKKKKKEEEEKKRKEEEKRKREEEEKRKREEEEKRKKEEEERKKKEEEERKKKEEEKEINLESSPQIKTESGKEEEQLQQEIPEKKIRYKRIYFKCYSDFDIPYDEFDNELIVETFKEENYQLIINPYFTFFGETLINTIKDYEAPLLPEREEPIIMEEEEEENLQMISPVTEGSQNPTKSNNKENKKNKEKEDQNLNTNNTNTSNANQNNDKKFSPMNTATSNISGKPGDKKDKGKEKEKENINQNQPKIEVVKEQEQNLDPNCKIGGITQSKEINTYKPNFAIKKDKLVIKDYGRLPSLRILEFGGDDLKFYQEYIPPYQLEEHIFNETNLFNFTSESDIMGKDLLMNIIQTINETDGYVTYKVLPYNFSDWKKFSTNKVRILPNKCKDIKNFEYPLVDKLNQQISKYKRSLFEGNLKDNDDVKNFELILHNEDFDQLFTLPEFFTLDIYKKNNIPHLIKTFSQGTFLYVNLVYAINKMCELLDINNQTGYGFCLIICKKFVFLAPLKEPYIYTKDAQENENKINKEKEKKEEVKENKENKENKPNEENKENINELNKETNEKKEENNNEIKNKKIGQRIPIFVEPYYFMGIYTLPYIESEWPESIERKNVKFDLIEILKKSTN